MPQRTRLQGCRRQSNAGSSCRGVRERRVKRGFVLCSGKTGVRSDDVQYVLSGPKKCILHFRHSQLPCWSFLFQTNPKCLHPCRHYRLCTTARMPDDSMDGGGRVVSGTTTEVERHTPQVGYFQYLYARPMGTLEGYTEVHVAMHFRHFHQPLLDSMSTRHLDFLSIVHGGGRFYSKHQQ